MKNRLNGGSKRKLSWKKKTSVTNKVLMYDDCNEEVADMETGWSREDTGELTRDEEQRRRLGNTLETVPVQVCVFSIRVKECAVIG
ncbi:hypothetical protein DPX16_22723 [Anabarilius grahami]|uniref:Uncharacterized protein n=1 Tax=Anabarilius grahami TaxID=495550 RepID=A0A3N0Z8X3_ANAGA|nr:hypothetical protein DPX16_22723 [Anabarilius grahami]